jgi:hypothetical protein
MAINVVVSNDDLTVLGPPAAIDLQVDIGPEGPRGSYIYSGFNDPNVVSGPFINNPQEVGDLYYRTSNNTIYQYTSQPGGDQWIEITNLQVVANDAQELYDQAELLSASSIYWAQSASASSAQALSNALAASALYVSAPYASATYLTMLSASSTYLTIAAAESLDTLPSQTGNNGKFLSTTGASAYWQTLNVDLNPYLTIVSASNTYLTQASASSNYLTQALGLTAANASATYLTQTEGLTAANASATYLTQSNASAAYLTQASASSTYLTQSSASSLYMPLNVSLNAQSASYTLQLSDSAILVELNNASANNLTVPLNSTVAFPIGTQINILQTGAGQTTIVATGGVTINATPGLKLRTQWSSATLIKRASDTWVAIGDLIA